jgi:hypothetical protein
MDYIQRSFSQSAIETAAYCSQTILVDIRQKKIFNLMNEGINLGFSIILAPDYSPEWVINREILWNKVEEFERRRDAQTGRLFVITLPKVFSNIIAKELLTRFCFECFIGKGIVTDIAYHDQHPQLHYFYIQTTLRPIEINGFSIKKERSSSNLNSMQLYRKKFIELCNEQLKLLNIKKRIAFKCD